MDVCSSVAAGPEATPCDRSQRRSRERRVAHARRSGDPRERDAVIEEFMPLAISLARGFGTNRDSRDDLVQVACLGLVKAFDRFDPERGLMFSSFAVPTILGELRTPARQNLAASRPSRAS